MSGLDGAGNAVYAPVFEKKWPAYDAGLLTMVIGATAVVALLYGIIVMRRR